MLALDKENQIAVINRLEVGTDINSPYPLVIEGDIPEKCHIIAPAVRVNGNVGKQTVIQDHHNAKVDPDVSRLPHYAMVRPADHSEIPDGVSVKGQIADFARLETESSIKAASVDNKAHLEAQQHITIENGVGEKNELVAHNGDIQIQNTGQGTKLSGYAGSVTIHNGGLPQDCVLVCDKGTATVQGDVEHGAFIYAENDSARVHIAGNSNGIVENKYGNTFVGGSVNTVGHEDSVYVWSEKGNITVKGDANQSVESEHGKVQSRDTQTTDRGR